MTDPNVPPNRCFPGGDAVAKIIAGITNKKAERLNGCVPVVFCARPQGDVHKRHCYIGYGTCSGADMAFGGPSECPYGCVGFGDCAKVCPVGAITMVDDFPVIDEKRCIGCGACVEACPKGIIRLVPEDARVLVRCSSKDPGKVVRAVCDAGCIHCKACIKKCPANAISEVNGRVEVDLRKCLAYGPDCKEVCIQACNKRHILQPFRPRKEDAESGEEMKAKAA